jgi:hypothetical protein
MTESPTVAPPAILYARDPFGNPICFVDERTVFTGSKAP